MSEADELRGGLKDLEKEKEELDRRLRPNNLFGLLDCCHDSLSLPIQVQPKARLTTENEMDPARRLVPMRIIPWHDFPRCQEDIWKKIENASDFTTRPLFASKVIVEFMARNARNISIYSENSLEIFENNTVDTFLETILMEMRADENLRRDLCIKGQVDFDGQTTDDCLTTFVEGSQSIRAIKRLGKRRNIRSDQFHVQAHTGEQIVPVYAVEFKSPHKLTVPELVAGLHEIHPVREVIDKKGTAFKFHATRLVTAVITQIFSYMIDTGVSYGVIRTGEAFVFLHIPEDPTTVKYYLCVPNQDVQPEDKYRLHRTAVGQMLAFTLHAMTAGLPSQDWHDAAYKNLPTWKVEFMNVLRDIPELFRHYPPKQAYRPTWKLVQAVYNTRARGRKSEPPIQNTRSYCTMKCIRGVVTGESVDRKCPNASEHGKKHRITPREFTRRLHSQLEENRSEGFEQLHIRGRTGFIIKATLLSHGYTVVIKATTSDKDHYVQTEACTYFEPRVSYWYHGQLMAHMMILSWSGHRIQQIINEENSRFFYAEREKVLKILESHGVFHRDKAWRNMLWNEQAGRLVVIDLEDVKWLEYTRPFWVEI
ncbi:uncharacterized protein N7511_010978 [Penicillium nucicola]|uniref:uncharacterized protein n=1 Tax=Penicillium nucicola TaxID=1850975 RepID=UPI002544D9DA|nr:uncharacterized protein N7511_010978 [Penicillium nucicola]KAJ5749282.1 hypothetical protein N7511_010978 [Penicillium nucicola]